jgi:hypothetical protein
MCPWACLQRKAATRPWRGTHSASGMQILLRSTGSLHWTRSGVMVSILHGCSPITAAAAAVVHAVRSTACEPDWAVYTCAQPSTQLERQGCSSTRSIRRSASFGRCECIELSTEHAAVRAAAHPQLIIWSTCTGKAGRNGFARKVKVHEEGHRGSCAAGGCSSGGA